MFITFEAGEGAGKSTQARHLKARFDTLGIPAILTREPGGSELAEELRRVVVEGDPDRMDAVTELLVFTAARRDHVLRVIQPALDAGKIVICDRYIGSTYALQGAAGVPVETIDMIHQAAGVTLRPDLTIHLSIDFDAALNRGIARLTEDDSNESRFEDKGVEYHRKVVQRFHDMAEANSNWSSIDGRGSIEEVAQRIWDAVTQDPAFARVQSAA